MRLLIVCLCAFFTLTAEAKETRCGWLENPSPANMWLIDRDGTWDISVQGVPNSLDDKSIDLAYQAIANEKEFVRTNRSYGFSCACLTVDSDNDKKSISAIYKASQLSLKKCLEDTSIIKHIPLRFR
ncbi:MAG: DUF4087 domain-containing protein [Mariprofundaceae bacterium]|nr:DUF4087 domain-containing protein [Mariprofundaceae bacterium]